MAPKASTVAADTALLRDAIAETLEKRFVDNWHRVVAKRAERKAGVAWRKGLPKEFPGRTSFVARESMEFYSKLVETLDELDSRPQWFIDSLLEEVTKSIRATNVRLTKVRARKAAAEQLKARIDGVVAHHLDDVAFLLRFFDGSNERYPRGEYVDPEIREADTRTLHRLARDHNWDFGTTELFWIARHDECGLATAALIYWRGHPEHILKKGTKLSSWDRECRALLKEIMANVRRNRYRHSGIPFDPRKDMRFNKAAWKRALKVVPACMQFKTTRKRVVPITNG